MTTVLIFISMFFLIPFVLYISMKNQFAGGKYNKKHDDKNKEK